MDILEVTMSNYELYFEQMLNLENKVKSDMSFRGIGDLFFTTGDGIKDYVFDSRHHVYVLLDGGNVVSQTYIIGSGSHIQGDYCDLAKYFTMDEGFLQYVADKYDSNDIFMRVCKSVYKAKTCAFNYALKKIYGKIDYEAFMVDLNKEKMSNTHFDERCILRRKINRYMSEFMESHGMVELYRQFFYVDSSYALVDGLMAYDEFLHTSRAHVYDINVDKKEDYYEADVYNTIEVDTYITDPEYRSGGVAKILSSLALSKTICEYFENSERDVLYLSVTLHRDNYLSESVASFLGFKNYIDLERRAGIERKVYMKMIKRDEYPSYLSYLEKKLSYFYGYGDVFVSDYEARLYDNEKRSHDLNIACEIDRRIMMKEFDDATLGFVKGIRDNIYDNHKVLFKKLNKTV